MRRGLGGPLAAALLVAAYTAALHRYGIFDLVDEGLLLVQAARVASGERPYLDFHTGYGPLHFELVAALLRTGGLGAVRFGLVVVHALTAGLGFALARRLVGPALAWGGVALQIAWFLPLAPERGGPFNAPYPAWTAGLGGVAVAVLLVRAGSVGVAALAGAVAGLVAAVKPSSGVLLAGGAALALVLRDAPPSGSGRVARLVAVAAALAALALLGAGGALRTGLVLVPPLAALALLVGRAGAADRGTVPRLAALVTGFGLVAGVTLAPAAAALGPERFAREVLLLGGGAGEVARVYGEPLPWSAVVAGVVAPLVWLGCGARPAGAALVSGAGGFAALAGGLLGLALDALSVERTVVTPVRLAEEGAAALVPIALWAALAALRTRRDDALAAATAILACAALQLHPRADFVHLMPLAPLVLPLALAAWRELAERVPVVGRPLAVVVPLVLAGLRFAPTVPVLGRMVTGGVEHVSIAATTLTIVPAGGARLRAVATAAGLLDTVAPAGARVLVFPACGIVPFAADRLPAGPHDYFFPGRPGRAEVAALVAGFVAAPPPAAVTCEAAGTDLARAWSAYPEMQALLADAYRVVAGAGPFEVRVPRR